MSDTEMQPVSDTMEVMVTSELPLDANRLVEVAKSHSDGTVEGMNAVLLEWGYPPTAVKVMEITSDKIPEPFSVSSDVSKEAPSE